jgi:hypothetical protein
MAHSSGMQTGRRLNVVEVSGRQFLLTATAGDAVHLTREAGCEEAGKAAVPDYYIEGFGRSYDMASIVDPGWAETTLCGCDWIVMEADRDGDEDEAAACVPSCRRCLALVDRLFPASVLDDRFPLVVQVVTDTVLELGHAELCGVPGDQQAALRAQVRSAVRKRTGYGLRSYVHESMVIFACDPIYQAAAVAGAVAGQPGDRYVPAAVCADADDGGDSPPCPGSRSRRPHRLAGLVLEDDPGAEGRRRSFTCGQVSFFQTSMAPSSRSTARRAPIWHDQPRPRSRYQIPETV